ncbi:ABC transporter ATP-binding protein [Mesorhizobium sangaii]|uniref:Subfamily B ATP-binding cassette protein MsbA n=1 Tax=Mesorhizobium sangaii TaxID=505389 RepID=A0A841PQL7_9HYPH|nr:ABC transporter ATP-binding protein [Mesorhizobium sangaii]MBB6412372.1 subfamily B ATP-binding cassette protein MsbA [Mesorhizobium sangaii]
MPLLPPSLPMLFRTFGKKQLRLLPAVVVLGLVGAVLEGFGIGLIIPLLGIIMGHGDAAGMGGFSAVLQHVGSGLSERDRLMVISIAILGSIVLKNIFAFANTLLTTFIYGKASHSIRSALSERLLRVGYPFFLRQSPGRLLNIISNESWRASDAIQIVLSAIVSASAAIILLAFLLLLSWRMTLLVTLGLAAVQIAHAILSANLKGPSRSVASRNSHLASQMLHLVHAGRLIRIFGQESREKAIFDTASDAVRRASFVLLVRQGALPPLTEVLHAALFLAVVIGAWLAQVNFPLIIAFVILLYRLQPHMRALQGSWSQLQGLSGSLEEVIWMLDPSGKPPPPQGDGPFHGLRQGIKFDDVTFTYSGTDRREVVLHSATFEIRGGRSTALIGRSGAGKTTIVNLLCRFVEPDTGRILVDGSPLDGIDASQWRQHIALASQELELVDGTIFENITYGQDAATAAEAERAARLAEAHEFIERLPLGYDTLVGYRGVNLSAGQRQRIALARALVRDPDLLILDEATNAVDGLSEAAIVETLKSRAGRRTTIVISHHHSTISFCDDVVILSGGRVKKQAPFGALASLTMDELYQHEQLAAPGRAGAKRRRGEPAK